MTPALPPVRTVAEILARLEPRRRAAPDEARARVLAQARAARERRLAWFRAHPVERAP